jgi:serine protease Do
MRPSTKRTLGIWLGACVVGGLSGATAGMLVLSDLHIPVPIIPKPPAQTESDASVTGLVAKVLPSVVSIDITQKAASSTRRSIAADLLHLGGGSGFFISEDGLIVTNKHVISDSSVDYTVITQDGEKYPAKVLALDPSFDLGVLKIDAPTSTFPALELGNSDDLKTGQTVIAIGNALAEFQNSVTKGIISGLNRQLYAGDYGSEELIEEAIQTDAAINPGNSGGPLITLDGKVIGMNTAVSDGAQSLGFALPASVLSHAVESVRAYGRIVRPWIGVRYIPVDADVQTKEKLPYPYGALIRGSGKTEPAIEPDSPAAKAGLQAEDVLLELDGEHIGELRSLSSLVSRHIPGDQVVLKVLRDGKEIQIPVMLEERPADSNK